MDHKSNSDGTEHSEADSVRGDLLDKKAERQARSHEWLQTLETWSRELIVEALGSSGEARGKDRPDSAIEGPR